MSATVLVVDDDPALRDYVQQTLEEQGYRVCVAADGHEALAQLNACAPAVVLLDLNLPALTGWGVLRELRAAHSMTPIICMTAAYAAPIEAQRQGASDYLGKPFTREQLLKTVGRFAEPAAATG